MPRSLQAQQAVLSQYASLEEAAKQRLTAEAEDPNPGKDPPAFLHP